MRSRIESSIPAAATQRASKRKRRRRVGLAVVAVAGALATGGVAAAATLGWLGLLAGPPLIGFLAGATGLRPALLMVLVLVATIAPAAPLLVAQRQPRALPDAAAA